MRFGMLARWFALVAVAFLACGRIPWGFRRETGRLADHPRDAVTADPSDGPASHITADACVPLVCQDPTCFPAYCGEIGDGCGGTLHCGSCAAGWSCKGGQCFPEDCAPITCEWATPFPYCGRIGDGCGGTLDCTCPRSAWTCVGHVCNAVPEGCVPIADCAGSSGEYCGGLIGDGCGGVLDCRRECSLVGFVCRGNLCVDGSGSSWPPDAGRLVPIPPPLPVPPPPPPPPCPPPPPPPEP